MNDEPGRFIPTRRSLLSRLRNWDDQRSWQDFFDTYWKLIYNTATKAGLADAEAQDVVQETVIAVSRKMQKFKYDAALGSFKGWLLNTTRWKILDHVNRVRMKEIPVADVQDEAAADGTKAAGDSPDPASLNLEEFWENEWRQNLMDAAMQRVKRRVSPKQFQLFELHVVKDWPVSKVTQTLGVNMAQVHLAKHRVSKLIGKEVRRLEAKML